MLKPSLNPNIRRKIIDLLLFWIPVIPEEDEPERPILMTELQGKIIEGLVNKRKVISTEQMLRGFIEGLLYCLKPYGIFNESEWAKGRIQCNSYQSYSMMKSWLEYIRDDSEYIDWMDKSKSIIENRIEILAKLEDMRVRKPSEVEARPIRVNNAAVAILKGHCKLFNQDVFLFQKKILVDAFGREHENWRHIGGKLRFVDILAEGDPRETFKILSKNDFKAKNEWMERCLARELRESLKLKSQDYIAYQLKIENGIVPLSDRHISNSQFQYTQYYYFPVGIIFKTSVDKLELFSRKNTKWLTLDYILSSNKYIDNVPIVDRVFKELTPILGRNWVAQFLDYSLEEPVPYELVKHINDVVHISQDLHLRLDTSVLFSEEEESFEKHLNPTLRALFLILVENNPNFVSYEKIRQRIGYKDLEGVWKLKSRIAKELYQELGREYIINNPGLGYSLKG